MGTRTFAPSQHNKAVWPKTAIFDPEYAFLSTYRPCWLTWCRFGWLNGGCGARAVSRRTQKMIITIGVYLGLGLGTTAAYELRPL